MPKAAPFEAHHPRYEDWFGEHEAAYLSELLALRPFVPWEGDGLEIGVGSGRCSLPWGSSATATCCAPAYSLQGRRTPFAPSFQVMPGPICACRAMSTTPIAPMDRMP